MSNNGSGNGSRAVAFLIGALAGGVAAALLTPVSGREAREKIKDGALNAYGKASDAASEAKENTREKVGEIADGARNRGHAVKEAATVAKDAYKEELNKRRHA
jgi:gas vesicle protein